MPPAAPRSATAYGRERLSHISSSKPRPKLARSGSCSRGADSGPLLPGGPDLPYAQLVPLEKCLQPESLVAFKLNDRFLPGKNGFPARALFPGWYAMDSVKWLRRMVVLKPDDQASTFEESRMNRLYNRILETTPNHRTVTRLSHIQVKSAIAWPPDNAKLPAGRHSIRCFAWTGAAAVRRVEFSFDRGESWVAAKLETPSRQLGWVRWSASWNALAGDHILMSRATDSVGKTQPLQRDSARKDGYELNFCAPVRCSVR